MAFTNPQNVYQEHGFANRSEYLNSLAEERGLSFKTVYVVAEMLGPIEDFDALVTFLDDVDEDLLSMSDEELLNALNE